MFIFVIVIILSGSILLASYQKGVIFNRVVLIERLEANTKSALNIMVAHSDRYPYDQEIRLSLYGEAQDSVTLKKEQWGAFDLLNASAFHKELKKRHSAIVGNYKQDSSNVALLIPEDGKSIALSGDVSIEGICEMPQARFSQPSIEGRNFTGRQIRSLIRTSGSIMPKLNENIAKLTMGYALDRYMSKGTAIIPYTEFNKDSLIVSFLSDSTVTLYAEGPIAIDHKTIKGKVVIISDRAISIGSSAHISDVQCYAPYIEFGNGFSGNLQAYATDSIVVGEKCEIKYPSVLGINQERAGISTLTLKENSTLYGIAFMNTKDDGSAPKSILAIAKNASVRGQVYSNNFTEIKGAINGSLYTKRFILRTPSSIYENTIMDASIDMYKLSSNYIGADLIGEGTRGGVIKWIY
jgi:cytoskeletal protein CcmA (bactofilin family)